MAIVNYHCAKGRLLGEDTNGIRTDYMTDALGSVTGTVNSSQAVVNTYRYKPFGELLAKTGTGADPKFMWNGTTQSRKTGLAYSDQYNRARHYGTRQGQWTTVDPLWPRERAYAYVGAGPVSWVDPYGLQLLNPPPVGPPIILPLPNNKPPVIMPGPNPGRPGRITPGRGGDGAAGPGAAIVIAVGDLIRWWCTGEEGPITKTGGELGRWIFPDPEGLDVEPGTVRNPKECSDDEYVRRQREVDKHCKRGGTQIDFSKECLKKPKEQQKKCFDRARRCLAARESICDCFYNGCHQGHQDIIDRLWDLLG